MIRWKANGRVVWISLISGVCGLCGLAALVIGVTGFFNGQTANGSASVAAGLFMVFGAMLDRFELLKGMGLEAKMRDLRRDIHDAEALLHKIHEVATTFAPSMLEITARLGRWSGPPPAEVVYRLAQGVRRLLKDAGQDEATIRQTLAPWASITARDVWATITEPIRRAAHEEQQRRQRDLAARFPPPIQDATGYARAVELSRDGIDFGSFKDSYLGFAPSQFAELLDQLATQVPTWLDERLAEQLHQDVRTWAPELRYLDEQLEFRDPIPWFERLQGSD